MRCALLLGALNMKKILVITAALLMPTAAWAQQPSAAHIKFFETNIRPILAKRCYDETCGCSSVLHSDKLVSCKKAVKKRQNWSRMRHARSEPCPPPGGWIRFESERPERASVRSAASRCADLLLTQMS